LSKVKGSQRRPKRPRPKRPSRAELEQELRNALASLDDTGRQLEIDTLQGSQQEIEASRHYYADLYDLAPFAHLTLDGNGIMRSLNLTATKLLGRQRSHLIGRPFRGFVAARDRHRVLSHLRELRRGQPRATTELEIQPASGLRVAVQMESIPVPPGVRKSGGTEYWTGLVDITERRRAEARTVALAKLGLLLSGAGDLVAAARAVVDTAQEYCGWDACFLLLYDEAADTVTYLINMDTIQGRRVPVAPVVQGGPPTPLNRQVLQEGPLLILRKNPQDLGPVTRRFGDTSRPSLALMFAPMRQEGRNIGVISIQSYQPKAYGHEDLAVLQALADQAGGALVRLQAQAALQRLTEQLEARITERTAELQKYRDHLEVLVKERTRELEATNKQLRKEIDSRQAAEEALRRAAEELKRSNQELEQFAYVVSHDLQEPLRAVGGYVRLLEYRFPEKVDEKVREYIDAAAEGATRMEQQLFDLLALSRVGTQGLALAPVNLAAPLDLALKNLQFSIRSTRAQVTIDPLPTLPVDESQFVQLFQNLIANALKFHGERPPHIHVGARAEDSGWVLWVRDNGIGIAPEYAERIFQVFQRLHTRKKYPGTGIGLSICQKIVQRHGGRIWVESQPGHGATFFFSIPSLSGKVTCRI
jgi:PAS domain S-box-containing protein